MACKHLQGLKPVLPHSKGCKECLRIATCCFCPGHMVILAALGAIDSAWVLPPRETYRTGLIWPARLKAGRARLADCEGQGDARAPLWMSSCRALHFRDRLETGRAADVKQ
jgi:hypothetical protein